MTENITPPPPPAQYGPYLPPQQPAPEPKAKKKWLLPAAFLIGGMILGSAGAASAKPEPVVQTKTETVTKEVKVDTVPTICMTALDDADAAFANTGKVIGYMSDAMTAAGHFNVAGINEAKDNMTANEPKFKDAVAAYKASRDECRDAG